MLWVDLRGETRYILGEEGTTEEDSRWTDEILMASANRCLRRLSVELPLPAKTTIAAVAGQQDYDLPEDFMKIQAVVYPSNVVRIETSAPMLEGSQLAVPGGVRLTRHRAWFCLHNKILSIVPSPDTVSDEPTITLFYYRRRIPLTGHNPEDEEGEGEGEDDGSLEAIDIEDDEANLVEEWIKADMMASVISPDALLTRWKEKGSRDDSPIIPATKQFYITFEQELEAKKKQRRPSVLNLVPVTSRRRRYGRPW